MTDVAKAWKFQVKTNYNHAECISEITSRCIFGQTSDENMKKKKKAIFNWSGGKDSALALYKIIQENEYDVISLLTTVNGDTLNSSIHEIPIDILEAQAKSIGLPLYIIKLPTTSMSGYDQEMEKAVIHFKSQGVNHFIFGDIFLYDIKSYRETKLRPYDIKVVEPLWNKNSNEIIEKYLTSGIHSKIIITQADKLDQSYIGCELDRNFIESLPNNVNVCGETGEYHTLTYSGPLFKKEIEFYLSEPELITHDIQLDNGKYQTYKYWKTKVSSKN
jgi:uncharacterized protein (TIGR00290 family)